MNKARGFTRSRLSVAGLMLLGAVACSSASPSADAGTITDSGKQPDSGVHRDAGVMVTSCGACSASEICVIGGHEGGACFLTDAGQMVADGGRCPNGGTGVCCNTFATYTCYPRPTSCGSSVTCGCVDGLCGEGANACHDDGTGGSTFNCIEELA